ncbi:MAG: hypothetical protein Fur0037_06820 [Planctomycetota bacterium]
MSPEIEGAGPDPAAPAMPWQWRVLLPYIRRELPGWGALYGLFGGWREDRWRQAGIATIRGKLHGYRMRLDLSNWSQRLTFCLGRYYDLPLQLAMQRLLRRGDTFVDVGANLGMISLLACRLVGPDGHVIAVEPNPDLARSLDLLRVENGLAQMEIAKVALGPAAGQALLHEFAGHSGWGSLIPDAPAGAAESARWPVPVVTGDELLAEIDRSSRLILKIDVEGYEIPALRGLARVLDARRPLVFIEAVEENQRRAGFSLSELHAEFERHGYEGMLLSLRRSGATRSRLAALPFHDRRKPATDALFVPLDGELRGRAADLLAGSR